MDTPYVPSPQALAAWEAYKAEDECIEARKAARKVRGPQRKTSARAKLLIRLQEGPIGSWQCRGFTGQVMWALYRDGLVTPSPHPQGAMWTAVALSTPAPG